MTSAKLVLSSLGVYLFEEKFLGPDLPHERLQLGATDVILKRAEIEL